jgi:hypothetical protein
MKEAQMGGELKVNIVATIQAKKSRSSEAKSIPKEGYSVETFITS